MSGSLPPTPQINAATTIWGFKYWFNQLYKWVKGESDTNQTTYTANFNVDQDAFAYLLYNIDTTAGAVTATLPVASGYRGKKYVFRKASATAAPVIIVPYAGDNINGLTSYALNAYQETVTLLSDGNKTWTVIDASGNGLGNSGAGRNYVVNGGFEIWQSGSSYTLTTISARSGLSTSAGTTPVALPDHWGLRDNSAGVIGSVTTRIPGFAPGSLFGLRHQAPAGTTNTAPHSLVQDLGTPVSTLLQGKTCTISFWARCGANFNAKSTFQLFLQSGTGVNEAARNVGYTGLVTMLSTIVPLTTTAQLFSYQVTVPANSTEVDIIFLMQGTAAASGAADYYELDNVQWSVGNNTNYEVLPFEEDLQKCLSWVYKTHEYGTAPSSAAGVAGSLQFPAIAAGAVINRSNSFNFPVQMFAVPVTQLFNPTVAGAQIQDITAAATCTATAVTNVSTKDIAFSATGPAGGVAKDIWAIHMVADGGI